MYRLEGSLNGVAINHDKIADIKGLKLNITWKLLYRGLLEKQISINEIVEYAKEQLEKERIELKYVSWQALVTMI